MDLLTYIKGRNMVKREWMNEDPENRETDLIIEDLEYWSRQGVTTRIEFLCKEHNCTVEDLKRMGVDLNPK